MAPAGYIHNRRREVDSELGKAALRVEDPNGRRWPILVVRLLDSSFRSQWAGGSGPLTGISKISHLSERTTLIAKINADNDAIRRFFERAASEPLVPPALTHDISGLVVEAD